MVDRLDGRRLLLARAVAARRGAVCACPDSAGGANEHATDLVLSPTHLLGLPRRFTDDAHDAPQDRNTIRLLRAVEGNAIAQMKKILEDGVDLGRRLPGKEVQDTFLLRALELQHEEAALLLLKHKADPSAANKQNKYPLLLAAQNGASSRRRRASTRCARARFPFVVVHRDHAAPRRPQCRAALDEIDARRSSRRGRAPSAASRPPRGRRGRRSDRSSEGQGNDLSMYAKVRLRALGAAYGEVAAIEGERYVVKTGAGYDSVAADELSADAKRAKTGGA